ncbi:hypothetical protein D9M71_213210 [compost metagenome]
MSVQEQPGLHQHLRQPRQVGTQPFEHQAEARHHITHQKQHHTTPHDQQQHGVDRGTDDFLPHFIHALPIAHVTSQGLADCTGLFAGLHQRHVQRREDLRVLRQGLGKRLALVQQPHQPVEGLARLGCRLLFGQAFQGIDQGQPSVEQGGQFLAEQHQGEGFAAAQAQAGHPLQTAQAEHAQALFLGLLPGLGRPAGFDHQ